MINKRFVIPIKNIRKVQNKELNAYKLYMASYARYQPNADPLWLPQLEQGFPISVI